MVTLMVTSTMMPPDLRPASAPVAAEDHPANVAGAKLTIEKTHIRRLRPRPAVSAGLLFALLGDEIVGLGARVRAAIDRDREALGQQMACTCCAPSRPCRASRAAFGQASRVQPPSWKPFVAQGSSRSKTQPHSAIKRRSCSTIAGGCEEAAV